MPGATGQELIDWLNSQLLRYDVTGAEASRAAGLNVGAISEIINGKRPGLKVCKALADYFRWPAEEVLRMAGHLPPALRDGENPEVQATVHRLMELWKQIEHLDPTGESLAQLTTIAITQAEMVKAAMRNAREAEKKEQGAHYPTTSQPL